MIIHNNNELKTPLNNSVITMGSFDGVHLGHRKILERVVQTAREINGASVLVTFDKHPRKVLNNTTGDLKLLTTPEERRVIFESIGIEHLVCLSFDAKLAATEPSDFIREFFVKKLKAACIITGYGHRFGKGGKGNHDLLVSESQKYGYVTEMIPMQDIQQNMISSTLIRQHLEAGEVSMANRYLGYSFSLTGKVVHGSNTGKKIGFPTANIHPSHPEKLIPADGVYAVYVSVNKEKYPGMMNIGVRPTFNASEKTIEVHIINFHEEIYDDTITVTFEHRLRDEKKFESVEALIEQLTIDKHNALEKLG